MQHDMNYADECNRCGCTRIQINDNLVPKECPDFSGPHATALIRLDRDRHLLAVTISNNRHSLQRIEAAIVELQRKIRDDEARLASIESTMKILSEGEITKNVWVLTGH